MSVLYKALKRQNGSPIGSLSAPYQPQTLRKAPSAEGISQILLPRRRAPAFLLGLLAVAAAFAFYPETPDPVPVRTAPSIVARPVPAAPAEPSIAMVAALLPPAAAATLPLDEPRSSTAAPARALSITVRQPAPASDDAALTRQGIKLAQAGDTDGAEAALRASLATDANNPLTLYNLAVLADRRGDSDTARTMYDCALHALSIRPQPPISARLISSRLDQLDQQSRP